MQRRAWRNRVIVVCGQQVALGRVHAWQTLIVAVSETALAIELDDAESRVVRRTTATPVRNIKADQPWTVPSFLRVSVNHHARTKPGRFTWHATAGHATRLRVPAEL